MYGWIPGLGDWGASCVAVARVGELGPSLRESFGFTVWGPGFPTKDPIVVGVYGCPARMFVQFKPRLEHRSFFQTPIL